MKLTVVLTVCIAVIISTLMPLAILGYLYLHQEDDHKIVAISQGTPSGIFNPELLSNRLIKYDIDNAIISEKKGAFAFGNVNAFLTEVQRSCSPAFTNMNYLSCSNKILSRHFFYHPSRNVSAGWSAHFSDCDLNVYLLMDAMRLADKESRIVYAPGHAFLAFADEESGAVDYWETTTNHNSGIRANLTDDFYKKTPAQFYYDPVSVDFAEEFYPVVVAEDIPSTATRDSVMSYVQKEFSDNPFAQDIWYNNKKLITREDAVKIAKLLQTDITSSTKSNILSQYLITHNQEEKARQVMKSVVNSNCGKTCLKIKSSLFHAYIIPEKISNALDQKGLYLPLNTIIISLFFSAFFYALTIIILFDSLRPARTRQASKEQGKSAILAPE
ncbi:hypothetical protein [Lelliottia sp.]|uniref:hypothetical protein n=1 Tax=Lelliottia sp. TaxID=1898429 RepID=UPI00388F0F44